jgi:hypothetical protein
MARPSKLSPEQWIEVERRYQAGDTASSLAREFRIDEAAIRRKFRRETPIVRKAAEKLAEAQDTVAALPAYLQPVAIDLASKLRNISASLASAAEHGAATAHRLSAIANAQAQKIDSSDPMNSQEQLQAISALTKISNDAASMGLGLISSSKAKGERADAPSATRTIDPSMLSDDALEQIMAAKDAMGRK